MPKPPVNAKAKMLKRARKQHLIFQKVSADWLFYRFNFYFAILWSSLFKAYPIEGKSRCYRSHQVRPILVLLIA